MHIWFYVPPMQIVDSIMALFRVDFSGRGELAERQQKLAQMLSRLQKISEEYNVAVFVTNQMTADPGATMTFQADPKKTHWRTHSGSRFNNKNKLAKGKRRTEDCQDLWQVCISLFLRSCTRAFKQDCHPWDYLLPDRYYLLEFPSQILCHWSGSTSLHSVLGAWGSVVKFISLCHSRACSDASSDITPTSVEGC